MNNITQHFLQQYTPLKSLIVYASEGTEKDYFVEAFDFDTNGKMINAHPLAIEESRQLGEILITDLEKKGQCFLSAGILPPHVLHINTGERGHVVWHTPAQKRKLYFVKELKLENKTYPIPPMLWKASREHLQVFTLKDNNRPGIESMLYNAPFFNLHESGLVCMGTVDIQIDHDCDLEKFMQLWDEYFFNSKFSHLLGDRSPVKSNIIQLYQKLADSHQKFPTNELIKHSKKLKQLLDESH